MKIVIEARALASPGGGIKTYVQELIAHLPVRHEYKVLREGPLVTKPLAFATWFNWSLPRQIKKLQPRLVHFTKAAVPRGIKVPTVVTIYDVIPILFPQSQTTLARLYWPATLRAAAQRSQHILTISEASKRGIMEELQVSEEKITVTPLAVNREKFLNIVPERLIARPYILFVGTVEPRKNVPLLIRAFGRIAKEVPHQLVIAGRFYKGEDEVKQEIVRQDLEERVQVQGFVTQEELPALYAQAEVFVWPSLYEGWGLPPLEAMAAGTPVVVSDGGSLPEVVGNTQEVVPFTTPDLKARQRDVEFEKQLAERLKKLLEDKARRQVMREAGLKRASEFTWEKVAQATVQVYEGVVK
jgi:glycosyltransferase involved in cell wall biosynthesis